MSAAIGPGDTVEFIGRQCRGFMRAGLMRGALYVVDRLEADADWICAECGVEGGVGIFLAGVDYPPDCSNCRCQLRPISDGQERIERPARVCVPA